MATTRYDGVHVDARLAGADLTGKLYYCVKEDTDGRIVLAGSGEYVAGIVHEEAVENKPVSYVHDGLYKAIAGAAITAGAKVMAGSGGKVVTATGAGANVLGICRNGASGDGVLAEIQIDRSSFPA